MAQFDYESPDLETDSKKKLFIFCVAVGHLTIQAETTKTNDSDVCMHASVYFYSPS